MHSLANYLNDHLAGAVTLIELLAHLEKSCANTDTGTFITNLRTEIIADRQVLEDLMARLGISQSSTRKATAYLTEKLAQLKIHFDNNASGDFLLFQSMEAASLGIEG